LDNITYTAGNAGSHFWSYYQYNNESVVESKGKWAWHFLLSICRHTCKQFITRFPTD